MVYQCVPVYFVDSHVVVQFTL